MKRAHAIAAALGFLAAACGSPTHGDAEAVKSGRPSSPCRAQVPANLSLAPAQWLGDCSNGVADGLGVMRAGKAEPYEFFAGRMAGGKLVDGVLLRRDGLMMVAIRFDKNRRVVVSDGLKASEDEDVFRTATASALATSRRFAAQNNLGSAAYYSRLADRIRTAPPE
ncbi:hypothetical protein SPKIRA_22610 [Sphingomonas paucimobilis]|uniref:Lipoprotein n=2 Tax=Sphingomonas paucimobilis TaxID=13689 RepID=A0A411LK93_SPHPI|nr:MULTISPECIES: hypothetical protein [Sphingomonas]MBQ1481019.1 hypothetical protein [Sphingomonas sp.]MCM3681335.1 hypothetical protein [Sphingomonas paucimobilis]NNG59167.1 hypothetical protein [Sphingomonas paucimobilis]QBE92753.1 hypothetical protein DRN02_012550 [Sphingomonas paucimobilis]QPS17740.1 hypothetical protein I6G65_09250 [Sphingomonas paucimobilis]